MKISRRYSFKSLLSLISYISLFKVSFGNSQILAGKDVVVIGAGISGLVAASTLIQKGANVIILEAKNYIGGRIRTDRSLGAPFEYGAGWIHGPSKDNPIRNLADSSNSSLFVTDDNSCELFNISGNDINEKVWEDDVGEVQNILRTSWLNVPFTKGAYSFPRVDNSEKDFENLAEPIDNKLFFCGEHTNLKYLATTHGALFTGIRAVKEVIKATQK